MASNLTVRIAFAAVAIPAVVGLLWLGGWPLAVAVAVLGALGTHEVYGLARRQGVKPLAPLGIAAAVAIPLASFWARGNETRWAEPALFVGALWLLAAPLVAMRQGPGARPLAAVAVTVFGALYASGTLAFLVPLRHPHAGPTDALARTTLALFPLALTWICDTAAMSVGRVVGGARLAPVLSPGKTWSGALGGAVGALIAAIALGVLVLRPLGWTLSLAQLGLVGLAVGTIGQAGDVAESLFKREAGVKDSSTLIPGHGGVLDRLDSLYFVIPVSAGLFKLYGIV